MLLVIDIGRVETNTKIIFKHRDGHSRGSKIANLRGKWLGGLVLIESLYNDLCYRKDILCDMYILSTQALFWVDNIYVCTPLYIVCDIIFL